ncbi:uncharacterized protein LOC115321809 [Ixodes scapularis]|uniref:uncharacterized protein LOC115321809 n=1 Tax=Ixodes scapularis TaxID=6945 RepID=UPI001A9D1870|nr:uncharacterized protein LOC115321809 [Ixodes scapularis]
MKPQRKHRRRHCDQRVPSSPDKEQMKKLLHSQKERARHRRVMAQLATLFEMVPLNHEGKSSKAAKFKQTLCYLRHLERSIQAECSARPLPIPPRCNLLTNDDGQRQGLAVNSCSWEVPPKELDSAIKALEDAAVVPDMEIALMTEGLRDDAGEWEIYGISQEDWTVAGPSQDAPKCQTEVVQTSYVDVVCDPELPVPLLISPEVFVVSTDGTVTSVGEQVLL